MVDKLTVYPKEIRSKGDILDFHDGSEMVKDGCEIISVNTRDSDMGRLYYNMYIALNTRITLTVPDTYNVGLVTLPDGTVFLPSLSNEKFNVICKIVDEQGSPLSTSLDLLSDRLPDNLATHTFTTGSDGSKTLTYSVEEGFHDYDVSVRYNGVHDTEPYRSSANRSIPIQVGGLTGSLRVYRGSVDWTVFEYAELFKVKCTVTNSFKSKPVGAGVPVSLYSNHDGLVGLAVTGSDSVAVFNNVFSITPGAHTLYAMVGDEELGSANVFINDYGLVVDGDVAIKDTVSRLAGSLVDTNGSAIHYQGQSVSFYEVFTRDKVLLSASDSIVATGSVVGLSARVLDVDESHIIGVPVFFEEEVSGDFSIDDVTADTVCIDETTPVSARLVMDKILDTGTVHCDSSGTNYCYSIGLDELNTDLAGKDFTLEFDYRNTVNGGRLCLGDASSWSNGVGAGDNYVYSGTSTAGNGGYGVKTGGTTDNSSTGSVVLGDILHYKIVRTGTTLNYYLNGTLKGSKTVPAWMDTCNEWSLYFQCWNTGDYTVENVCLDVGSDNDLSGFFVRFYVDEPEGVDDEVIIPVAEVEPVVSSVGLTGDKSVLSAYDYDTCILTATVLDEEDNPMEGESVVFKQGSTTLATETTNSSGVAEYTYSATGSGDVSFTASVGSVSSSSVSISDVYFHRDKEYSLTKSSGSVLNQAIDNNIALTLPSDFELTFEIQSTGGTSSNEHRFFLQPNSLYVSATQPRYGLFVESVSSNGGKFGYRNNGSTVSIATFSTFTPGEYHTVKLVRSGNTVTFYFDDESKGTQAITYLDNYTDWNFYFHLWNNGTMKIRNITLKED